MNLMRMFFKVYVLNNIISLLIKIKSLLSIFYVDIMKPKSNIPPCQFKNNLMVYIGLP